MVKCWFYILKWGNFTTCSNIRATTTSNKYHTSIQGKLGVVIFMQFSKKKSHFIYAVSRMCSNFIYNGKLRDSIETRKIGQFVPHEAKYDDWIGMASIWWKLISSRLLASIDWKHFQLIVLPSLTHPIFPLYHNFFFPLGL